MDRADRLERFALETSPAGTLAGAGIDRISGLPVRLDVTGDDTSGLAGRLAHERLARLAGPHVARALGAGRDADAGWWTAREALTNAPATLDADQLARVLPGWLSGLGALHAAGLVHGALGPDSFGFDVAGAPRLAEIGRGWRIGQSADHQVPADARPFAAPEVLSEGRVDARADLYAVGALCYRWLVGEAPSGDAALRQRGLETLSRDWAELIAAMLRPHPARRPASAGEVLGILAALGRDDLTDDSAPVSPSGLTVAPGVAGVQAPTRQVPPLVGRRTELTTLLACADEVADVGAGRIVTLAGAAGSGKSRLMAELRHRLITRGWTTIVARPDGGVAGAPYGAFAEAIRRLLAIVGPAVVAEATPILAAILPELTGRHAPAIGLEPRAAMLRLCRAVATLIEEACSSTPVALCLEDWHAADAASRELLAYLDRALPAMPYMIVLATRERPEGGTGGTVVPIEPLGGDDARTAWRGAFGHDRGGRGKSWDPLLDDAGGNPGMLEALADACAGRGPVTMGGSRKGRGGTATAVLAELAPTRTLQGLWAQRLAACSPGARALAAAAAVTGPRAGLALLGRLAGLEDDEPTDLMMATQELLTLGAVVPEAEGLSLVAPEEAALAEMGADTVRALHAHALAYWRTAAQLGAHVSPALLARHALASEDTTAGVWYATVAAREALALYALDEAEVMLEGARARMDRLAGVPVAWHLDLLEAQGDLARFRARPIEAEPLYREALELAEIDAPARAAGVRTSLAIALNLLSRGEESVVIFGEAYADMRAARPVRLRAANALARHHVRHGAADAAIELCRTVAEDVETTPLMRGEALGLLGLINATLPGQDVESGLAYLEEARLLARESGDRLAQLNAAMLTGNALNALGRLSAARTAFERYVLLGQELGLPDEVACATLNLAQVAYAQGKFQEAWDRSRAGAKAAGAIGNRIYEAFGLAYAGLAGCHLGQLSEADRALADAEIVASGLGGYMRAQIDLARLETLIFLGRLGRAEELGLSLAGAGDVADGEFQAPHALLMGQLYEVAGELETAMNYLRTARRSAEASGNTAMLAAVALAFGHAALRAGQLTVADGRAQEALALAVEADTGLVRLRAELLLARVRWQLGRSSETYTHLAAAEALARDLGSPHWQAIVWAGASRFSEGASNLRHKAAAFLHFYLNQLSPIARQEFLGWPERREVFSGRGTGSLEVIVPKTPLVLPFPQSSAG